MKHGEASEKDRLRSKWKELWLESGEDWPSYQLKWAQRKGRKANLEEIEQNPRSRSAQLRVLERVDGVDTL
jgi:16S rRNA C1402 N4-methylase RsmH